MMHASPDSTTDSAGAIFNIQRYALHDGPGIRTTVFFQGCPLRCWWCHNPESQEFQSDQATTATCRMTIRSLLREIEKDRVFFDESGGGVTFSGGEPLMQPEFLLNMLQQCAAHGIHTAVDTSGYASSEIFHMTLACVNLVLFDLKIPDDDAHRRYTGGSNRLIIENLRQLAESGVPYQIRVPVIPGITDTPRNIDAILTVLHDLCGMPQVNLLPYHRMAPPKYERLGRIYRMGAVEPPTETELNALQHTFEAQGFRVVRGG